MEVTRVLGEYRGKTKGPLIVFVAGIHGNELSGIHALNQVFSLLESSKPEINGRVVGLAGNVKAIREEKRYLDEDMNRIWLSEGISKQISECIERDELIETISQIRGPEDEEVTFIDLHATSAPTTPFLMISDTLRNRELAHKIGVPIILGLLEQLHGMLIDVTSLSGIPTLLFQAGREGDPGTVEYHKALIWKVLSHKCKLEPSEIPEAEELVKSLDKFKPRGLHEEFYEINYLYSYKTGVDFTMNPGYENFQHISAGEELAVCKGRKIKAPRSGLIFMPTYQEQSNEGFYIINPIAPFWIRLSAKLRKIKYHNKLHWLVGVKKVAENPLTYRVDQQITFLWALQIFHLLGYTVIRRDGHFLFMTRRGNEISPPLQSEALEYFTKRLYMREEIRAIVSDWRIPFSGKKKMEKVIS
jgi:predicted deacylase